MNGEIVYLTINRLIKQTHAYVARNTRWVATLMFLAFIAFCIVLITTTSRSVSVAAIGTVFAIGIIGAVMFFLPVTSPFSGGISAKPRKTRAGSERRTKFKNHIALKNRARTLILPHRLPYQRQFRNNETEVILDSTYHDAEGWEPKVTCWLRITHYSKIQGNDYYFVTVYTFKLEPGEFTASTEVATELYNNSEEVASTNAMEVSAEERSLARRLKRNKGPFDDDRGLKLLVQHMESFHDFQEVIERQE